MSTASRSARPSLAPRLPESLHTPQGVAAAVGLALVILATILGPILFGDPANERSIADRQQGASLAHPFGTDDLGRDLPARVVVATRVSVLPTLFGEKIVMRLLDKDKLMLDMTKLGFEAESLAKFESAILRPWGMVLVTGPTGSGKTNTLYSSIAKINTPETNIMTAEDPVEFNLAGINQVQVNPKAGLTFASALRSILRSDPDVVLLGEIRDHETAQIAIEASLTGHLVLSTLHTNDAPSAAPIPAISSSAWNVVTPKRLCRLSSWRMSLAGVIG